MRERSPIWIVLGFEYPMADAEGGMHEMAGLCLHPPTDSSKFAVTRPRARKQGVAKPKKWVPHLHRLAVSLSHR